MKIRFLTRFLLFAAALTVPLTLGELHFRGLPDFKTYCEKTGIQCTDSEASMLRYPWIWSSERNTEFVFKAKEFVTTADINSDGFPGIGFDPIKRRNSFRILFLGDSFTFGIGAPKGKGFVDDVRRTLEKFPEPPRVEVMNAGCPGSDPVFYLQVLKRQMLRYHPDLVVMMINSSDIDDISRRGGNERFDDRGFLKEKKRPWFNWIFKNSYLFRAFLIGWMKYDWNLQSPEEARLRSELAVQTLIDSGRELREIAVRNKFRYLVLFTPYPPELYSGLSGDMRRVIEGYRQFGITFVDITEAMARKIPKDRSLGFYWPIDWHFNENGYSVFADAVVDSMFKKSCLNPLRPTPRALGAAR